MGKKIRIFIGYHHDDIQLAEKIATIITEAGMIPLWSKKISLGKGFDPYIKFFIECAHAFIPVLTENISIWVNHEIGYAMAHHVPFYPVMTTKTLPKGMIETIHAISIPTEYEALRKILIRDVFSKIQHDTIPRSVYTRAQFVEDRASMMKEYADILRQIEVSGIVRQKGGLSSFHIPNVPIHDRRWINRYLPEARGNYHKEKQLGERVALQNHATVAGCRLIINPFYAIEGRSPLAAKTRLQELIDFFTMMPDDKVIVAIQKQPVGKESLTIVGDWFLAESVSFRDGDGFTNTFFTRNAFEITKRIEEFDYELTTLLRDANWTETDSKKKAIVELETMLNFINE